jgi:hypothetical protein
MPNAMMAAARASELALKLGDMVIGLSDFDDDEPPPRGASAATADPDQREIVPVRV